MTIADIGNGLAVLGPEVPGLLATLAALAYRTTRGLSAVAGTPDPTERTPTT